MSKSLLVLAALFATALFLMPGAATEPASPAVALDPISVPLPPEQFAKLDMSLSFFDSALEGAFYNGSAYQVESLDVEVQLADFAWAGDPHNSRDWVYRVPVMNGHRLDVSSFGMNLGVEAPAISEAGEALLSGRVIGAHGFVD